MVSILASGELWMATVIQMTLDVGEDVLVPPRQYDLHSIHLSR